MEKAQRARHKLTSFISHLFGRNGAAPDALQKKYELRLAGQFLDIYARSIAVRMHAKTPRSLKYLKDTCPRCMELPEDCKYVEYSIFNVDHVEKKLSAHDGYIQVKVVEELGKINPELAYHLRERLEDGRG